MTALAMRVRERTAPDSTRAFVGWALALYALFRVVAVPVMTWAAHHQDPQGVPGGQPGQHVGYWDMTHMWDGQWYENIARSGYPGHVPVNAVGQAKQSELAFYPVYPLMVRAGMALTGGSFAVVGSLFSLLLGAATAVAMAFLLRRHVGTVASLCTVAVVMSSPPAVTFQMTYTEALAMLLLVIVLLALDDRRWVLAGTLGLLIGFTRPIGVPLTLVVLVVVLRRWRERSERPVSRGEYARMAMALGGCGISGALWPLTAWALTGRRDAYTATMAAWRDHEPITPFSGWFDIAGIFFRQPWAPILVVLLMVATAALVLGPWSERIGLLLRVWCGAYALYLFATVVPWSSTLRYLLELFPLAAVLVGAGWRRRSALVVPLTVLVVIVNVAATPWWAWEFLRFVPPYGNPI